MIVQRKGNTHHQSRNAANELKGHIVAVWVLVSFLFVYAYDDTELIDSAIAAETSLGA